MWGRPLFLQRFFPKVHERDQKGDSLQFVIPFVHLLDVFLNSTATFRKTFRMCLIRTLFSTLFNKARSVWKVLNLIHPRFFFSLCSTWSILSGLKSIFSKERLFKGHSILPVANFLILSFPALVISNVFSNSCCIHLYFVRPMFVELIWLA